MLGEAVDLLARHVAVCDARSRVPRDAVLDAEATLVALLELTEAGREDEGLCVAGLPEIRERVEEIVEAAYLERLARLVAGDARRAEGIAGISRSGLYDLLKKHRRTLKSRAIGPARRAAEKPELTGAPSERRSSGRRG